jgi:outer membrane protein OmpA-like peptidoglycan-associated protein
LNGGFEDINTCTEYKAECGVEGWFYLQEVKAQMMTNETNLDLVGANSYALYYNWAGYTDFVPLIGTLLPCRLQKGNEYIFRGLISAKLNPKLILNPGICTGDKFFVPRRPFSKEMKPDSIVILSKIPNTPFFQFEYRFTAKGDERYLTFGSYVKEDTVGAKKKLIGTQTITMVLDNFKLIPVNPDETLCEAYAYNKESIYEYNSRHKEMDYSLFGKGELAIEMLENPQKNLTRFEKKLPPIITDTLKLGDVLFDFNKANLKPAATSMLGKFFSNEKKAGLDSIYIEGHTDSIGSEARNMELSRQRSESLKEWLIKNEISSADRIFVRPFGKSRPVASNKTESGRALNRRVELVIFRRRN